jgi:hypothetical protein
LQTPRGRETSNTATNDDKRNLGPRILRHSNAPTIAHTMPKDIGRANNLTRGKRQLLIPPAGRKRHRQAKKCS